MATWINDDGLPIQFGVDEGKFTKLAGYKTDGDQRYIEIVAEADHFPATTVTEVIDYTIRIPEGAIISKVEVAPNAETFVGGTSIDVGLVDLDGTSNGDVDAVFAGQTLADLNAGTVTAAGVAVNGAALTSPKLLTWTPTGTFSAGVTTLRVFYVIPKVGDTVDTLVYTKP